MTETLPVWEPQFESGETPVAYRAFLVYRDLGLERSLTKAVTAMGRKENYVRTMQRWSSQNDWVDRCRAWDKHQVQLADQMREDAKRQLIQDELADYDLLLAQWRSTMEKVKTFGDGGVHKLPDDPKTGKEGKEIMVVKLNVGQYRILAKTRQEITQLGRLALGLPQKITSTDITSGGEPLKAAADAEDELARALDSIASRLEAARDSGQPDAAAEAGPAVPLAVLGASEAAPSTG